MYNKKNINKILLIGSGPIVIGQGAEFDFSGSQACKSFREENKKIILINPNPATIMTDSTMADLVYTEPINIKYINLIIEKEKPDSIIGSMGGQIGLNIISELFEKNIINKYNLNIIGTNINSIKITENRDLFKKFIEDIEENTPVSYTINSISEVNKINDLRFPLVIRPSYTLGGEGSSIVYDRYQLYESIKNGLNSSRINQIILEECLYGWTEIEYEVIRDQYNTIIIVCGMENIDPIGIHTGDSIVVSPI